MHDLAARTGRAAPDIARAYRIVREAFALPPLWAAMPGYRPAEELAALVSPGVRRRIEELGIRLTSYGDLAAGWYSRSSFRDVAKRRARNP